MKFSKLKEIQTSRDVVSAFGGYNHSETITEGEFYDMKNMSSTNYPVLSPREKRGTYKDTSACTGIVAKDDICYVENGDLYIGNNHNLLTLTNTKKQLISMGAYLVILPDKKYINTKDFTDKGDIEASYTTTSTVTYTMCNIDGEAYSSATIDKTAPSNPSNLALWIDTSSTPNTLKQYSASTAMWVSIATTYIKISSAGIASQFNEGDAVKISGINSSLTQLADLNNQTSVIWSIHKDEANNNAGDYIIVIGMLNQVATQSTALTLKRSMPNMDFVIEANNRLWGCRYGTDINGNMVNEIYSSKLGDFKNWNCFAGISSDSYAASCGTDGAFTGAISHLGYPVFFKENCLHKVYGNYPSNFQIQTTSCKGVMHGAGDSVAIVNEVVFYKSRNGICVYDGSVPSEVSAIFGDVQYSGIDSSITDGLRCGAVAGYHNNKYYISMKSEKDNEWHLFVYDTTKGLWHKEDSMRADAFCSYKDELYYIDHATKKIKTIHGSGTKDADDVPWMVETGIIGTSIKSSRYTTTSLTGKKYISQLLVRMGMEAESRAMFFIQYDSIGEWEHIQTISSETIKSFNVPIRPKRCDHFKLRIEGSGNVKIYSISKTIEKGSDY